MEIRIAQTDEEIEACRSVMAELRPHVEAASFLERIRRQQRQGYELVYGIDAGGVEAVAGFRLLEMLVVGRLLYVDDLVTRASVRSRGYGHALFEWLVQRARNAGCRALALDSGVERYEAHRFYLRERMSIRAHHFVLEL